MIRVHSSTGRDDRGAAAVIIGIVMFPLVLFVAFATDLGLWFQRGQELQTSADLAALAAAAEMPDQSAAAVMATSTLRANGIDPSDPDIVYEQGGNA